ncbi:MAG: bifunctional diguanylate cyclase/phosphodiesterase [Clostridiales bacterium]|nr:bifunctional diguanylate cyclase/phosphodiesterase [Clostridiales bacterium]
MYGNARFYRWILVYSLPFVCYGLSVMLRLDRMADMWSALNALVASTVLFASFVGRIKSDSLSAMYLLSGISCLLWGIADMGWAILTSLGQEAMENEVLWIIYALPNVFLSLGLILLIGPRLNRWSRAQLATDTITVLLLGGLFLWTVFFEGRMELVRRFFQQDFTSLLSVLLDILMAFAIVQWLIGAHRGKLPTHLLLLVFSLSLYCLVDLTYFYSAFQEWYTPNGVIDFCYGLAFYGISLSAVFWGRDTFKGVKDEPLSNIGPKNRWFLMLMIPVVMLLLQLTGVSATPLNAVVIVFSALIVLENWWATKYIQLSILNAQLLEATKRQNLFLEDVVSRQNQKLKDTVNRDAMTQLYTRQYFVDLLDAQSQENGCHTTSCLMIMDIDRLNAINKAYGTDAGDHVILECVRRLQTWNGPHGAILARMVGGEFGIYLCGEYANDALIAIARELLAVMRSPMDFLGERLCVSVSIGLVVLYRAMGNAKVMVQNAEMALDHAKSQGYDQYYLLDSSMYETARHNSKVEVMLRNSLVEDDFELYYQPQFSLPEQTLVGAEALIRWKNVDIGYIPPSIFIPIAEDIGLIHSLGKWVVRAAIRQAQRWREEFGANLRVSVNVSPAQLKEPTFAAEIERLMREGGASADWLELEITESIMLQPSDAMQQAFRQLVDLGFVIAIDDFGAGHASFGYMSLFPFQKVKIDKLLVDSMETADSNGVHVVKSIIDMARMIRVQTIAEGVEHEEQLALLKRLGCDQAQGFLLGRPVRADDFEKLYLRRNGKATFGTEG